MTETKTIGRNDPCPCGSGKKYKYCCLRIGAAPLRGSPQYFTLKGRGAEQLIQQLAERTFLADWCYANPHLPNGNELCDLLVVFGSTAIIWQIKNLDGKGGQFKTSDLEKNMRQLAGARRQLFDLKTRIEVSNARRGRETLDVSQIGIIHLVSVILGQAGGTGVQALQFVEEVKGHLAHMFVLDFAELVLNELDTINDFCRYLAALEATATQTKALLVLEQRDLLAHYLANGRSFRFVDVEKVNLVHEGAWNALRKNAAYIRRKKEDQVSYVWDHLIDMAHGESHEPSQYEKVAREMAKLDRYERRLLATNFLEGHEHAQKQWRENRRDNIFRRVISLNGITYCFLFMENPVNERVRLELLEKTCFVARGRFKECCKVIGIATGMTMDRYHRFHFGLLEVVEWTKEHQDHMEQLQREFGILTKGKDLSIDYERGLLD
jgi:hypothetical protein